MTRVTSPEFWHATESIHAPVYYAPDARARYQAVGLKGFWMGYIASRAAPLGTPSPELVIATFHGFSPRTIHRALPDAWGFASRDDILEARLQLARDALAPALDGLDLDPVSRELAAVVDGLDLAGKPMGAALAGLHMPDDPIGRLWHAASILREYRGDCHIAVLTTAGLDGAAANALAVAVGLTPSAVKESRGWTDQEWEAALDRLRLRDWVDAEGQPTATGRAARARLEDATDRTASAGIDREATARTITVAPRLAAIAHAVREAGLVPS